MSNIMDAIDSLDYVLDDIENIEAPDRHKEDQKKMNEGVSEARKGLDLIVDAFKLYEKGDSDSIEKGKEKAQEGAEVLQHADKMWRPTLQSLHAIAPDSYEQALRNQSY